MKQKPLNSSGSVADAWEELDRQLEKRRYMRISLDTTRDWDDARKRRWNAVAFMEKGQVIARVCYPTRDQAIVELAYRLKLQG